MVHEVLGNVTGLARLEFARRRLACAPERLVPIHLSIHDEYDFTPTALPVIAEVEACYPLMAGVVRFIECRLRLKVNASKSAVAKPEDRHFLGFRLRHGVDGDVEVLLSKRSIAPSVSVVVGSAAARRPRRGSTASCGGAVTAGQRQGPPLYLRFST